MVKSKKYLIFNLCINTVGGSQFYVLNKARYMESLGYETYIFSCHDREIVIPGLRKYKGLIIDSLEYYPSYFNRKKQEAVINRVLRLADITSHDDVVIESTRGSLSVWAEMVAERCNGKHYFFSISEKNEVFPSIVPFFEFKHSRGELFTISAKTFLGLYAQSSIIKENDIPVLSASMGELVADYPCEIIDKMPLCDRSICIIGRLAKSYMPCAAQGVGAFCRTHPETSFCVAVIGDVNGENASKSIEVIRSALGDMPNVTLVVTGALTPLPQKMFSNFDLFIGGAGCATLPYRNGSLTLGMSVIDGKALGLMGYDVTTTFTTESPNRDMVSILEDALFTRKYIKKAFTPTKPSTSPFGLLDKHIEKYGESTQEKAHYPARRIRAPLKKWIGYIVLRLKAAITQRTNK